MNIAQIQQQVEEARQNLRDEGRRDGQRQGERRLLLRLLRSRFGELPQMLLARVEAAEPDELEGWAERVLTAKSVSEVFGDS